MKKADLFVHSYLSKHMCFGSPYETFDSCGNCDGARCDYCKERWMVTEFDDLDIIPGGERYGFETKEDAKVWAAGLLVKNNIAGGVA